MIAPGTWAVVELMGHRQEVGRISEAEAAGCKFLRVDTPRGVRFYSGSAIYAITPTTEESCRARFGWLFDDPAGELEPVSSLAGLVDEPDFDDELLEDGGW